MLRRNLIFVLAIAITSVLSATVLIKAGEGDVRVANAALKGDQDGVRNLLKQAADVNGALGDGSTALHFAAQNGDAEMAQVLIYAGANVRASTRIGGYTPLFMASKRGAPQVIDILLKAGADPNLKAMDGLTPLTASLVVSRICYPSADPSPGIHKRSSVLRI